MLADLTRHCEGGCKPAAAGPQAPLQHPAPHLLGLCGAAAGDGSHPEENPLPATLTSAKGRNAHWDAPASSLLAPNATAQH